MTKTERKKTTRDPEVLALERCKRILDELPAQVARRVSRYLVDRVEEKLYGRLTAEVDKALAEVGGAAIGALSGATLPPRDELVANRKLG